MRHVVDGSCRVDAGIVAQDVDVAQRRRDLAERRLHLRLVADVGRDRDGCDAELAAVSAAFAARLRA